MPRTKKIKDMLTTGALTLFQSRTEPEVLHPTPVQNGIAPGLVPLVRVFDNAPEAEGLFASHFGINLSSLAGMSPEQLAQQTDVILQAKQFAEYIPVIEQHIKDYVKAVTDYNTFIARCVKEGAKGIKEIDKSKVDVMLEWFGYKQHQEQLGRKGDNAKIQMQEETKNFIALSDFSLDVALRMKASAVAKQMEQISQRPELAAEQAEIRQAANQRKQEVKNLILNGTAGRR